MSNLMNKEERKAWDADPYITLTVAGKPFYCKCGCNVFQHIDYDKSKFSCSNCKTEYTST